MAPPPEITVGEINIIRNIRDEEQFRKNLTLPPLSLFYSKFLGQSIGFSGIRYLYFKIWGFISGLHEKCGPTGLNVFRLVVPKFIMAITVDRIFSLRQRDKRNGRPQNQKE
jgi:hypothetical protein